jgi:hypothetical protein
VLDGSLHDDLVALGLARRRESVTPIELDRLVVVGEDRQADRREPALADDLDDGVKRLTPVARPWKCASIIKRTMMYPRKVASAGNGEAGGPSVNG